MSHKIAIIVSEFNNTITHALRDGAIDQLKSKGMSEEAIEIVHVPGAVEIPLAAQILAKQNKFSAIICLGAVIRGETTHYDYVCDQVSQGCQRVMLNETIPVIFGVLTTENEAQAEDRIGGKHGHKGRDAADAALSMIAFVEKYTQQTSRCGF